LFLPVPRGYSSVPGLSFEWQYIEKNIAEGRAGAALLLDEQLWLTIHHDGSNPFCSSEKCRWRVLFLAPTTEVPLELHVRGDTLIKLVCLPYQGSIKRIDIVDGVFENRPGIWVVLDIEDDSVEDGEEYDIAFPLVEYARSG
jgi:hypothetical protein